MHPRALALIRLLDLTPHPEGGYYREVFRSPRMVRTNDPAVERAAINVVPGRWVIVTRQRRRRWEVIVEPDPHGIILVVITAYPLEGN